jgi:cadmium resistance protein CadD (predicted permease)
VFAPLFAALGWSGTALAAGVFAVLAVALCAAALRLGSRPAVVRAVDRAGDVTVPVVLVALGVYVVLESGLAG